MAGGETADGETGNFPIIDAHQHFWDLEHNPYPWLNGPEMVPFRYGDYSAIRKTFLPADYRRAAGRHNIVRTVHLEAEWDRPDPVAETRWLEALSGEYGLPSVIVGHAEPDREDIGEVLAGHAASPMARGIRHKPAAVSRAQDARRGARGSMDDPRWRDGYALLERVGFSYDLQTPWWHLPAAAELAADFPGILIIVNHTGLPENRSAEALAGWRDALETVAAQPNVAIKISGLGMPGEPWTVEANGPVIEDAISIFGVERCMFASNWPVDTLAAPLSVIYDGFREVAAKRPLAEQRALFHDNAVRFYRM